VILWKIWVVIQEIPRCRVGTQGPDTDEFRQLFEKLDGVWISGNCFFKKNVSIEI
jgi:hypothetical protein